MKPALFPLQPGVVGTAEFDELGMHRLVLTREWDPMDKRRALWIGMNPSKAGADMDDPTVRQETNYTRHVLGYGGMVKCNVMDFIATNPSSLPAMDAGVRCSRRNLLTIRTQALGAETVIACWGTLPEALRGHVHLVKLMLDNIGIPMFCRGKTADGSPRHGRGVRYNAPLIAL